MTTKLDTSALENSTQGLDFSAFEIDQNDGTDSATLDGATILIDTREGKPYQFDGYEVDTESQYLEVADYTLEGYESTFAVERKAKDDFLKSLSWDHDRFKREAKKASRFKFPMAIVVEAPWCDLKRGKYYRDVPLKTVVNTVEYWRDAYHITWYFEDDRQAAEQRTIELLSKWYNDCS